MHEEERLIRQFAAARDRGDAATAAAIWSRLVTLNYDRLPGFARVFRFAGGSGFAARDYDDAVQAAATRVVRLGGKFRGASVGEFRVAFKTEAWNGFMDYGREVLRYEKGIGGSLDERRPGSADAGPHDAALARWLDERAAEAADAEEAEERAAAQRDLVHWAVGQIPNEKHREVLRMSFDGMATQDIAGALRISMDNVYARHSRGIRELKRILREHA